ncbi:MAG: GAF domain-containing protein [Anaerolineales bacterium]|nr:GAF domain-containing protein [Anaerolineales bacterium]
MLTKLLDYLRSEEDHEPSFIRLTRNILIFAMITTAVVMPLVTGITGEEAKNISALIILAILLVLEIISFVFVLRGNVLLAKVVVPASLVIGVSAISATTNGLRSTSSFALPVVLIISAILLGRRSLFLTTPIAVIATIAIAVNDMATGTPVTPIGLDDTIIAPVILIATAGITQLLIVRLNESTLRARQSEQVQKLENAELMELRSTLEERVHVRTAELETANKITEKRARQFKAVAQVMSAISTVQSLDELLPLVTQVISQQFNVYHTGVFLIDDNREFAVLRASNSEGGQRMLARKHALPIGQTGIVGFATATGQPRIVLDVGADSVYFDNPDLPDTHSEIALPLRYSGQVIGALDVQSLEINAFQSDDVDVLTTLADQVAVAINHALVIEEAKKSLAEAQSAVGQVTEEAWQVLRPTQLGLGFSYSETGVKSLKMPIDSPQIQEALKRGEVAMSADTGKRSQLAVPIRLRGQVIGVMQLSTRGEQKLSTDEADIAEAVAERLSLAIETATLLQSTQHRADIERITAKITSNISSSARFETILQTAAQELSSALGGSDVIVQIEPAALKMYS